MSVHKVPYVFIAHVHVSALLAWNKSKGFVYAYYGLDTISCILSEGSILFISIAYVVIIFPYCY